MFQLDDIIRWKRTSIKKTGSLGWHTIIYIYIYMKSYTVVSRALLYVEAQGLDVIVLNGPVGSDIYIYKDIWTVCDSINC